MERDNDMFENDGFGERNEHAGESASEGAEENVKENNYTEGFQPSTEYGQQKSTWYDPMNHEGDTQGSSHPEYREQGKGAEGKTSHLGVKFVAAALVCALIGGVGGGAITASVLGGRTENEAAGTSSTENTATVEETENVTDSAVQQLASDLKTNVGDKSLTPADVYSAYVDSVVGIANESTTNFFGQVSSTASSGSGFIITEDGYIVTNYHVIEGADKLTVTLNSGDQYEAEVIGYEEDNDVALIKIEATGLSPVSIGDSDDLKVGETVCAIGNPLGELTNTLTTGTVSALDREINTDGTPVNMLQTDCAINEGNSGGPLFDMNGNVIGITTAKYYGDTIEGIGFAIPINDVMRIVADLKEYGYVTGRPYIGVTLTDMDGVTAEFYNLPVGVYVNSVEQGSPAETAGIEAEDIITGLGDVTVENYTELVAALKNYSAGDTATITVYRAGQTLTLDITFGEKLPESMTEETESETEETVPEETAPEEMPGGQNQQTPGFPGK